MTKSYFEEKEEIKTLRTAISFQVITNFTAYEKEAEGTNTELDRIE